jgi:hypothetical protein
MGRTVEVGKTARRAAKVATRTPVGAEVGPERDIRRVGPDGDMRECRIRRDGWTSKRRKIFLDVLGMTANVREASAAVGLMWTGAYALRRRDPAFAEGWADALEQGYAELEMHVMRQSLFGTQRTETVRDGEGPDANVLYVRTVHSYPLAVAMRLLQAHRPEMERRMAERAARAEERPDSEAVIARVRAAMAEVKLRLTHVEAEGAEAERARVDGMRADGTYGVDG